MRRLLKWVSYIFLALIAAVVMIFVIVDVRRDILLSMITDEVNKGIRGRFSADKLKLTMFHDFPHFSLTLHNASLTDSLRNHRLFSANKVFIDVNVYELLRKNLHMRSVAIEDAQLFLYRSQTGYVNTDMFRKPVEPSGDNTATTSSSSVLLLPDISFRNFRCTYADSLKEKLFRIQFIKTRQQLDHHNGQIKIRVKGRMKFDELTFNAASGSFVAGQDAAVDLQLALIDSSLVINQSVVQFKTFNLLVDGEYGTRASMEYALRFDVKKIAFDDALVVVNDKIRDKLERFKVSERIDFSVVLKGMSAGGDPDVDVRFQGADAQFAYGQINLSQLDFTGAFTYRPRLARSDTDYSKIVVSRFAGRFERIPCSGTVTFTALENPVMDLDVRFEMKPSDVNSLLDTSRFVVDNGVFISDVRYYGRVEEYLDATRTFYQGALNGKIRISSASVQYKMKKLRFENINASFNFTEKQFDIKELTLELNRSVIHVGGTIRNFIPFFIRPKDKGNVSLTVYSPDLDLTPLIGARSENRKRTKKENVQKQKMTSLLDLVYKKLEFDIHVKADRFALRKFRAKNVFGGLRLSGNTLLGKDISMGVAGGLMNVGFRLADIDKQISPLSVRTKVNDARIEDFFLCFDNFHQRAVQAHNLAGNITADISFRTDIDDNYSVIAETMRGTINTRIKDGHLKDFEPLASISNFLFKKRDFSDVQFAELSSHFDINGTALDIQRMEIQSSVLSMFVQGRYSFTDSTSLSVQLPLSNLKKRDRNYKPENIGTHAKAGPSVFLHLYRNKDVDSKMNIAYDPFKKWVRK